jgi:hypothetical protein
MEIEERAVSSSGPSVVHPSELANDARTYFPAVAIGREDRNEDQYKAARP